MSLVMPPDTKPQRKHGTRARLLLLGGMLVVGLSLRLADLSRTSLPSPARDALLAGYVIPEPDGNGRFVPISQQTPRGRQQAALRPPSEVIAEADAQPVRPTRGATDFTQARARIETSREVRRLLSDSSRNTLRPVQEVSGSGVRTFKFQHFHAGLEVIGSMVMLHEGPAGEQIRARLAHPDVNPRPAFGAERAIEIARDATGGERVATEPALKILPDFKKRDAKGRLVYQLQLEPKVPGPRHDVTLDAHTGRIIASGQSQPVVPRAPRASR